MQVQALFTDTIAFMQFDDLLEWCKPIFTKIFKLEELCCSSKMAFLGYLLGLVHVFEIF